MNRLRMLLVAAALMAGGSALASAQLYDHDGRDGGRFGDRDHRDRDDRRFADRDDHRYFRDRDDRYFRDRDDRRFRDRYGRRFWDRDDRRFVDRDDYRFFEYGRPHYIVGDRRWINGYLWTWDGYRWCRRDRGVVFYFGF